MTQSGIEPRSPRPLANTTRINDTKFCAATRNDDTHSSLWASTLLWFVNQQVITDIALLFLVPKN